MKGKALLVFIIFNFLIFEFYDVEMSFLAHLFDLSSEDFKRWLGVFCLCVDIILLTIIFNKKRKFKKANIGRFWKNNRLLRSLQKARFTAQCVHISDGDSIVLMYKGAKLKVRLYGVDSPEKNQPFADESKEMLKKYVNKKMVEVEGRGMDQYGRLVAIVKVDNVIVQEVLLTQGLTWYASSYCMESFCDKWKNKEEKARRLRKGLWAENNPKAPWVYKKENKMGSYGK